MYKKGDIITIIGINGFAMCSRAEFKYHSLINGQHAVTENRPNVKKKFVMPNLEHTENDRLTFTAPVPFQIEGERTTVENGMTIRRLSGDTLFKFYGTPKEIKEFIEQNNLNKNFTRWDSIMALDDEDNPTPVYPEVPTDSHPVMRVRETSNNNKK